MSPDVSSGVAHARAFVSVGLGLDLWLGTLEAQAPPKSRFLKLGDRVPTLTTDDGAIDPYVWMDPQRARLMAAAIAEDLARTDSSHAVAFRDRASALDASLGALDREIEARVAGWPTHDIATLPPSMAYFAERYGLHGSTATARPGARQESVPSGADASVGASTTGRAPRVDVLGGGDAKVRTYEDLIRFDAAALEPTPR
jgi:ABC-type Zn uptake system ZnuABC Zn-binding protein ZnuA